MKLNPAVDLLVFQCQAIKLPAPVREVRFHDTRRWRFDLAWPDQKLAVEVSGGAFMKAGPGRHNRGAGYREDCVKYSSAAALGWRIVHCLPEHVQSGVALNWIEAALKVAA